MTTKVFEVPADKLKFIKAILDAADKKDPTTGKWIANEWALRGYKLNDAKVLGLEGTNYYIYVKADDNFFKRNEKSIIDAGAKLLSSEHATKIIKKIEEQEESAQEGIGAIFG